jgi:hypothetical protein
MKWRPDCAWFRVACYPEVSSGSRAVLTPRATHRDSPKAARLTSGVGDRSHCRGCSHRRDIDDVVAEATGSVGIGQCFTGPGWRGGPLVLHAETLLLRHRTRLASRFRRPPWDIASDADALHAARGGAGEEPLQRRGLCRELVAALLPFWPV